MVTTTTLGPTLYLILFINLWRKIVTFLFFDIITECGVKTRMSQVNHNAPAGQTYSSIQDAGKSTLQTYCDNYPNTSSSYLLPNIFLTSFPDVIDNPQVTLTDKQKRQFDGFVGNLKGEREEYDIYLTFTKKVL